MEPMTPWLFMRYGMNIIRPIKSENNSKKYFIQTIDYLTK